MAKRGPQRDGRGPPLSMLLIGGYRGRCGTWPTAQTNLRMARKMAGRTLFVSMCFFVPPSILALLIVWTFIVPVPIPTPPFRSDLVSALERSNATLRATQRDNITADAEALARFLPNGKTIKEFEIVVRNEGFLCGPFQDDGASEAARWGEKYRHYVICERTTYYHPFYMFGWRIELFANRDDVIESVRARRRYDGL
jgi:hypothetical protein